MTMKTIHFIRHAEGFHNVLDSSGKEALNVIDARLTEVISTSILIFFTIKYCRGMFLHRNNVLSD